MEPVLSRGLLRVVLVVALATASQAIELPEVIPQLVPTYGSFGFVADDTNTIFLIPGDLRKGVSQGDHGDWRAMPREDWHGAPMFALAPIGERVTFHLIHNGRPYTVTRTATFNPDDPISTRGVDLWVGGILWTVASLILVLVGVALVLVRPSRITWAFFLYACGAPNANLVWFYSFLPPAGYIAASVASFVVGALAPLGFLLLALRLPRDPPLGWRKTCDAAVPWLFAVPLTGTVGAAIQWEVFGGPFRIWNQIFFWSAATFYAVGLGSLVAALFDRSLRLRPAVRFAIIGLSVSIVSAMIELVIIYFQTIVPAWVNLPNVAFDIGWFVSLIISLAVAYTLIRYRIIDVRYVVARSLTYATLAGAVLALFAVINIAFSKWVYYVAVVIPIEIAVAVLLGYRFSGLADVASALALADVDAPAARLRGRRAEEREILARALDRAERTRRAAVVTEVRARAAFSAWLAGEDEEFARHVAGMQSSAGNGDLRGLGFFLRATQQEFDALEPARGDLPEWVARGYLVACGSTDDASAAAEYASSAVIAADAGAILEPQVLARIARAEFAPEERRALYASAAEFAASSGSLPLQKAVHALQHDAREAGILTPFISRLRAPREGVPALDVRFLTAQVLRSGAPIALREGERALLFALAHREGLVPAVALADALWPELDGDQAAGAFRVCLHRLRRGLGDSRSIVRTNRGCRLQTEATADLWKIRETVNRARSDEAFGREERLALLDAYAALRANRAAWSSQPAWFAPYEAELSELMRDAARLLAQHALTRADATKALEFARAMIEDDPFDDVAREIAIRGYLTANDRPSAVREYRRYMELVATGGVARPLSTLEALFGTGTTATPRTG